jgi:tetratricopeptide (TPR) repeat protein
MRSAPILAAAAVPVFLFVAPGPAWANRESTTLAVKAAAEIYNLDREQAIATYRAAIAADPRDARAYRGLATALWLSITFKRGNMTVDDYLGRVSKPTASAIAPPPETVAAFQEALNTAITIAREQLAADPKNADAHYQLGSAIGLRASYIATVENSSVGAFRAAREAYDEHQKVLELDPQRKDAGLIVGTYRYIVSTLVLPLRWVAYMAGFGGDKDRGIQLIEEAAAFASGDNREDARFALILLYNREKRYDGALEVLQVLRERFPRNRLAWLESGATALRAGRDAEAERFLNDGLTRFASDTRARMFGEDVLWYSKRGIARARLGRTAEAQEDLRKALSLEGRKWAHGRAHLELGRIELKAGRTKEARRELQEAVALCESDNDPTSAEEAKRLLK